MAKNQQVLIHPLAHWPWFQAHSFSRLVSRSTVQGVICVSGSTLCLCMHRTVVARSQHIQLSHRKIILLVVGGLCLIYGYVMWEFHGIFLMLLYFNGAPKNVCASKLSGGATSSSSGGSSKAKTKRKSEDETIFSTTSLLGRGQLSGGYEDIVQLL